MTLAASKRSSREQHHDVCFQCQQLHAGGLGLGMVFSMPQVFSMQASVGLMVAALMQR
jgi:hypothetical protein